MPQSDSQLISSRLQNLSLNTSTSKPIKASSSSSRQPRKSAATAPIADSWEEENEGTSSTTSSDTETESHDRPTLAVPKSPVTLTDYPSAPPPTPVSRPPTSSVTSTAHPAHAVHDFPAYATSFDELGGGRGTRAAGLGDARPEKTTQTAARMIAGALGVRAPKRTEEERQYDRAMRDNERKKKEREREDKRLAEVQREKAIRAVWDD